MAAYEAVFWDVGGVILNIPSITRAQRAFIERAAERFDIGPPEEALEVWRGALREHFAGREGTEYRTAREGRTKAAQALFGDDVPEDELRAIREETTAEYVEANPDAIETIHALDDAGFYLAVISDADAGGIPDTLDRYGVRDCFDDVTTSEEVGRVKPDRRIFERALEKAGIDASNGIMIGDKYENDMVGGSQVGLTTVAYGADDGPAVDFHIDDLRTILDIVGV